MQGADDVAMDEPVQETAAAGGSQDAAVAAAAEEVPSSSNGVSPKSQRATGAVQKRVALPEHAKMVTQLQVCSQTRVLSLTSNIQCCAIIPKGGCPKARDAAEASNW